MNEILDGSLFRVAIGRGLVQSDWPVLVDLACTDFLTWGVEFIACSMFSRNSACGNDVLLPPTWRIVSHSKL